jgi:protein TonB
MLRNPGYLHAVAMTIQTGSLADDAELIGVIVALLIVIGSLAYLLIKGRHPTQSAPESEASPLLEPEPEPEVDPEAASATPVSPPHVDPSPPTAPTPPPAPIAAPAPVVAPAPIAAPVPVVAAAPQQVAATTSSIDVLPLHPSRR